MPFSTFLLFSFLNAFGSFAVKIQYSNRHKIIYYKHNDFSVLLYIFLPLLGIFSWIFLMENINQLVWYACLIKIYIIVLIFSKTDRLLLLNLYYGFYLYMSFVFNPCLTDLSCTFFYVTMVIILILIERKTNGPDFSQILTYCDTGIYQKCSNAFFEWFDLNF